MSRYKLTICADTKEEYDKSIENFFCRKGSPETVKRIAQLIEMLVGGPAETMVLGRNVPMCVEVDAIKVMGLFAAECPEWGAVAKKYRELRAQPTSLYAGKAIE